MKLKIILIILTAICIIAYPENIILGYNNSINIDQALEFLEDHKDSPSLKIIDELLDDDQNIIQVSCYILMLDLYNYENLISNPIHLFTTLSNSTDPFISGCAARALGKTKNKNTIKTLINLIENSDDHFIIESSVIALGEIESTDSNSILLYLLNNDGSDDSIK